MQQNRAKTEQTVAFWWSKKKMDKLRILTHQLSLKRNQHLTASDLIREAIEEKYPELNK